MAQPLWRLLWCHSLGTRQGLPDRSRQLFAQLKYFLDQLKQLSDLLKQLPDLLICFKQTYKQMSKRLKQLSDQLKQLPDLLICFKQIYKQMSKRLKRLWLLLICFKQRLFAYLYVVSFAPKMTAKNKASPRSAGETPARRVHTHGMPPCAEVKFLHHKSLLGLQSTAHCPLGRYPIERILVTPYL
jgi:hypothetical protein